MSGHGTGGQYAMVDATTAQTAIPDQDARRALTALLRVGLTRERIDPATDLATARALRDELAEALGLTPTVTEYPAPKSGDPGSVNRARRDARLAAGLAP